MNATATPQNCFYAKAHLILCLPSLAMKCWSQTQFLDVFSLYVYSPHGDSFNVFFFFHHACIPDDFSVFISRFFPQDFILIHNIHSISLRGCLIYISNFTYPNSNSYVSFSPNLLVWLFSVS